VPRIVLGGRGAVKGEVFAIGFGGDKTFARVPTGRRSGGEGFGADGPVEGAVGATGARSGVLRQKHSSSRMMPSRALAGSSALGSPAMMMARMRSLGEFLEFFTSLRTQGLTALRGLQRTMRWSLTCRAARMPVARSELAGSFVFVAKDRIEGVADVVRRGGSGYR